MVPGREMYLVDTKVPFVEKLIVFVGDVLRVNERENARTKYSTRGIAASRLPMRNFNPELKRREMAVVRGIIKWTFHNNWEFYPGARY